jgi:hypothetical protein
MINIVIFGAFLWMLLTCYPNLIKSHCLNDSKYAWGEKKDLVMYEGVNPICVRSNARCLGMQLYYYGNDPQEKLLLVMCSVLTCS